MSYAADVKKELTGLRVHDGNAKAELSALMRRTLTILQNF